MEIYIIRHGETDYNKKGALQGRTDIPLNAAGEQQARDVAKTLASEPFDLVFTSPLNRAKTTAALISGRKPEELSVQEELVEMCFGEQEGHCVDELPQEVLNLFDQPECYKAPEGGETIEQVKERCQAFLDLLALKLKDMPSDTRVLIVSHGATIHGLVSCIQKTSLEDFWKFRVENCMAIPVDFVDGEFVMKS